jgi:hypothetical protein
MLRLLPLVQRPPSRLRNSTPRPFTLNGLRSCLETFYSAQPFAVSALPVPAFPTYDRNIRHLTREFLLAALRKFEAAVYSAPFPRHLCHKMLHTLATTVAPQAIPTLSIPTTSAAADPVQSISSTPPSSPPAVALASVAAVAPLANQHPPTHAQRSLERELARLHTSILPVKQLRSMVSGRCLCSCAPGVCLFICSLESRIHARANYVDRAISDLQDDMLSLDSSMAVRRAFKSVRALRRASALFFKSEYQSVWF